jgi:hypothetical protein
MRWNVGKIDAMLVDKARMSSEVIASSGEGWITELDNDQILGPFRLGLTSRASSN